MRGSPKIRASDYSKRRVAAARRRWRRKYLAAAAALVVIIATAGVVTLLWRPSGAVREGPPSDFVRALLASEIPSSTLQLQFHEQTPLTLKEADITEMAAAALDRKAPGIPAAVSDAIARAVPDWVETVSGCRIEGDIVTLYVKCRKWASFYLTVSGALSRRADGSLLYRPVSARVGLVSVPSSMLTGALGPGEHVIIDPAAAGIEIRELKGARGEFTLEIVALEGKR